MREHLNSLISSSDLKDLTAEMVDLSFSEAVCSIPIAGTIFKLSKIYTSISDSIFLKKSLHALLELKNIEESDRIDFLSSLDDSYDTGAEKIMMLIDKLQTTEKARVFGRLCKAKMNCAMDAEEFLRLSKLIQDAYLDDLKLIMEFDGSVQHEKDKYERINKGKSQFSRVSLPYGIILGEDTYFYAPLISLGLIQQHIPEPEELSINHSPMNEYEPEIKGGKIEQRYFTTGLGDILISYYDYLFEIPSKG